jgi:ribose transport system substrate-binding protein
MRRHAFASGWMAVALAISLLLAGTTTAGAAKQFVVGYANGWIGNYWRAQFLSDLQRKATVYQQEGILKNLVIVNSPADLTLQINQINGLIAQHVDAILIDPVSAPAVKAVIPRAKAAGIFVLISNDPAPTDPDVPNVVGDNYTWMRVQVEWLVDALHGKGDVVQISGVPGNTADILRQKAVHDVLAMHPQIKVIASAPGWWDAAKAQQAMATILASHPTFDAVLEQDIMAMGVIRAFQAAGRPLPHVMTGDYVADFLRYWAKHPEIDSIGVPYAPAHAGDSLGFALRLLQGRKIRADRFVANPLNPSVKNAVMIPPPLVVTRSGDTSKPWCTMLTHCITLTAGVQQLLGKPDTSILDRVMSENEIDSYFEK